MTANRVRMKEGKTVFELSLNNVMKHMGTTCILKDININVYAGERVGIIGENGCGKSTILKMIAGIEPLNTYPGSWSPGYDYGWISVPKDASIAYLDQIPCYEDELTVSEILQSAFEGTQILERRMRVLEKEMELASGMDQDNDFEKVLKEYGKISQQFESQGGYETTEKMKKVCNGLNFTDAFLSRKFMNLSGGEKTTVELGKILMIQPDILLLDEPTNHLDTDAIEWLEQYLKNYKGIIAVVSHDRHFLDAVVSKIVEIEDLTTQTFNGNYSKYKHLKSEQMRVQMDDYHEQKKVIASMEKQIRELREWAIKADNNKFFKRAASIQIKLDKLVRIKKPIFNRRNMRIDLTGVERSGKEVVRVEAMSKSYGDKVLLRESNLSINYGERVALLGSNGSGKSTLVKMLMSQESIDHGSMKLGAGVNVAYLPQYVEFNNEEHTVLECFRDDVIIEEGKGREYLAKFMFYGKRVYTQVKDLSGGERIRLKLAKLLYENVNLLILDEPTNHLDILSIETLENALELFEGSLLFISHDRYFINRMAKKILHIENKQLTTYPCSYDAFRESTKTSKSDQIISESKEVKIKPIKEEKRCTSPKAVEKKMLKLESEIEDLEIMISDLDFNMTRVGEDHVKLHELYREKCALNEQLELLWHELEQIS